jgi:hypothetical protein
MNEVVDLKVLENYHIWIKFNDGEGRIINFRPYLGKGFTAELLDYDNFSKVRIEDGGGIVWENGYDFCPNYLREIADAKKQVA